MTGDYLLVTPVKNEEKDIPALISSIVKQTQQPKLWLIVDDGSTDKSSEIIANALKEYSWIYTLKLSESARDIGFHYSHVCRLGFENVIKEAEKKQVKFEYIALLDADMRLEKEYFHSLIQRMKMNPKIGIASGGTWSKIDSKYIMEKQRSDLPSGGARIWRYECFKETNGYENTLAPDSVSNARAKMKGWKTARFEDVKAYQSRPASGAEGMWKGYMKKGEASYYLSEPFFFACGKAGKYASKGNIKLGVAYLWGYIHSWNNKKPRISDPELRRYFRKKIFMKGEL